MASMYLSPDTSWFDSNPQAFLSRDDFKKFAEIGKFNLEDFMSEDPEVRETVQESLIRQSVIAAEIRKEYGGFVMPLLYYTHDLQLAPRVEEHNLELDKCWLSFDMGDSLRRRHHALSHAILPNEMRASAERFSRPIVVGNLGSGIGLDATNAVLANQDAVQDIVNYEINPKAVEFGQALVQYLEQSSGLKKGLVRFEQKNYLTGRETIDMAILIGIICGMNTPSAKKILTAVNHKMSPNGTLVVSSSNYHMLDTDPLPHFLAQHLGRAGDPMTGWGLNCRTPALIRETLTDAGFADVQLYDDANFPYRSRIEGVITSGLEKLPSLVSGREPPKYPLALPAGLKDKIGYNWIAVARKRE